VSTLGKIVALLVIAAFIMSSLLTVNAADYSMPALTKPLVPEFSVKILSYPYDVKPVTTTTTTIDEYTGKETTTTTTTPGYHVKNQSIEVTIKNQQFTPYSVTYTNDWPVEEHKPYIPSNTVEQTNLYYDIEVKGHYGTNWNSIVEHPSIGEHLIAANLNTEYTVVSCETDYDVGSSIDIRVMAYIGYSVPVYRSMLLMGGKLIEAHSDWSNIQTLTINENGATTVSQETTATPTPTAQSTAQIPATDATQTQTSTPPQLIEQTGSVFGFDNEKVVFAVMGIIIVVLLFALIVSNKRKQATGKTEMLR
jgi:uncharacterized integral membrane protein